MDNVAFDTIKTKAETCCISFNGLRKLYELKTTGRPLPQGWQIHVWEYLKQKSGIVQQKQEELEKLRKQDMEAVAIARSLHASVGEM